MTIFLGAEHADLLATIAQGAEARRKKAADAERTKRDAELVAHVNRILTVQLAEEAENAKRERKAINTDAAKAFVGWVRDGEMILPLSGTMAAAHIVGLLLEDAPMDRLRSAARAIEHIHNVGEWFLDLAPIRAALAFAEVVHSLADNGDDGGGTAVTNDDSPPPTDYEMPLAAAGAAL